VIPEKPSPPRSVSSWTDPFVIAGAVVIAYGALRQMALTDLQLSLILVGVVMAVMIPIEWARSPARRLPRPAVPFSETLKKASIKTLGILAGLGLVLLAWTFVPEYARKDYRALFDAMPYVLPEAPLCIFVWVLWTEWRMGPLEDHGWHFGLVVLQRYKEADWNAVRDGLFAWLVKGFFLPLNLCGVVGLFGGFRGREADILTADWPTLIATLDHMIFAVLLISIIPGYLFSARILGTEIKKTDETWFGWMVTFFCYPPVNRGVGSGWFAYVSHSGSLPWITWFGSDGAASYTVGLVLVFFYLVHYWGESICCLRSSHLTNRGVITNGPFRVTKHPVYVAKCLAWSLIYLPFLTHNTLRGNITHGLSFLAFCSIYVMRGWIEERVLSTDPDYVAYALWMEDHSLFRFIGRRFPVLSFAWRLKRWQKNHANL
jgi:protein-S-isoprenylcysteine O-methyltransferase Ste14